LALSKIVERHVLHKMVYTECPMIHAFSIIDESEVEVLIPLCGVVVS